MPRESAGAGFIYSKEQYRVPFPAGTGQVTSIDSLPVFSRCQLASVNIVAAVAATGAGASRTFNVRKGSATGTVIATATVVLADLNALGKVKTITPSATGTATDLLDSDTVTVEWATAGAVAFTAGEFIIELIYRRRLQQRN
jgi:hypothetical protein